MRRYKYSYFPALLGRRGVQKTEDSKVDNIQTLAMFLEILVEIILVTIAGLIFSYLFWIMGPRKISYGEFLNKYGYGLAYLGLLIVALIVGLTRTL